MKLSKLSLKQFRNLEPLSLEPHENLNLIVGLNASGKTNLCEALFYASRGQLLKGERQREIINWDCQWSTLNLEVGSEHIRIVMDNHEQTKTLELSGELVKQQDLFDVFKVLIFTPDDLQIVKGSPSKRRRMLDRSIADLDVAYRKALLNYEQVLKRKNILLRRDRPDPELLSVYQQQLVEHGTQLVRQRLLYLNELNKYLSVFHQELNQAKKPLFLKYESDVPYDGNVPQQLEEALKNAHQKEIDRRMSLIGPHRDDVCFDIEGMDVRRYGSQGQQKTALIALKLAQLELFKERLGEYPVLILDDVLSELDPERTQMLLNHLPQDLQLFLTETDLSDPLVERAGKVFRISHGQIEELSKEELCPSQN